MILPQDGAFLAAISWAIQAAAGQQTHRLEHEKLGEFEIFLTPVSADQQNGTIYEAVFHRFRKP